MNYYVKKDLSTIVRAKKGNTVAFATQQALTPPALKREGYIVEHASLTTPGLITRSFMNPFEFTRDYYEIDLATIDMINLGALITSFGAADVARPTVASTTPSALSINNAKDAIVSITFNEEIQVIGSMKAAFYHMVDGELTKIEDATSMTIGGAGNKTLTIGHSAFLNEEVITCVLPANSVEDASANTNNYNTAYTFRFTTIPALEVASVPADDATDVAVDANMVVTYNNALNDSTSTFALTKTSDASAIASDVTYDEDKKVVTVNPGASLIAETGYTLTCHAVDIAGQVKDTVITFTVESPELTMTSSPVPNNNSVALDSDIVLTFSNAIATHNTVIKISDFVQEGFTATLDQTGKILTIVKDGNLMSSATHTVAVTVTDIYSQELVTSFDFTTV